jgi:transketolase
LSAAIEAAKAVTDKPSLICCRTVIGWGSPNKAGSHDVHGAPLGDAEIAAARPHIGWNFGPFEIPQEIYQAWDAKKKGAAWEGDWQRKFEHYAQAHPELAAEYKRRMARELPANWKGHRRRQREGRDRRHAQGLATVDQRAGTRYCQNSSAARPT